MHCQVASISQELAASHAAWDALELALQSLKDVPAEETLTNPLFADILRYVSTCSGLARAHRLREIPFLRFRAVELPDLTLRAEGKGKGKGKGGGGHAAANDDNFFHGHCWKCGVYGHRDSQCPTLPESAASPESASPGSGRTLLERLNNLESSVKRQKVDG